jgi:pimeloyl-ACP methyl ester carboxylesterase
MTVETQAVSTLDGRTLRVHDTGGDGPAIVFHHGTPGCGRPFAAWVDDARTRGARLVGYDRAGYGGSTPQPSRNVASAADDTRAVADALGLDRFAVWGVSGGGPHALACAALLPKRVTAVAIIGSIAPWGAEGLDFYGGMGADNVTEMELYHRDRDAARRLSLENHGQLAGATIEEFTEALQSLLSPVDAALLVDPFGPYLVSTVIEGLAPGDDGGWDDNVAHMSPWGFDLARITIPAKVWHGAHDRFVPVQHGRWLLDQIPGAQDAINDDDGHLSVIAGRIGDIHAWLLGQASPIERG